MEAAMNGHALLIGVDSLDTSHYVITGNYNNLDVDKNFKIINEMMIKARSYSKITYMGGTGNTKPTWENIQKELSNYHGTPQNEEFLTIYLLCHACLIDTPIEDGSQFICIMNRLVYLKEWRAELAKIDTKYNVFIVSDSCYSGDFPLKKNDMQNTFNKHYQDTYHAVINDTYNENFKANFFFLNSSEKGKSSKIGYFTPQLRGVWESEGETKNYIDFARVLRERSSPKPSYLPKPNNANNRFFQRNKTFNSNTAFPLEENKPTSTNTTTTFSINIQTDEIPGRLVGVRLSEPHSYYYTDTASWNFDDDYSNPTFQALVTKLILLDHSCLDGIEFIGVVYVNLDHDNGSIMPIHEEDTGYIKIKNLKSLESVTSPELGNGLIVLEATDSSHIIVGKKRTQGKVTNKQGGE